MGNCMTATLESSHEKATSKSGHHSVVCKAAFDFDLEPTQVILTRKNSTLGQGTYFLDIAGTEVKYNKIGTVYQRDQLAPTPQQLRNCGALPPEAPLVPVTAINHPIVKHIAFERNIPKEQILLVKEYTGLGQSSWVLSINGKIENWKKVGTVFMPENAD